MLTSRTTAVITSLLLAGAACSKKDAETVTQPLEPAVADSGSVAKPAPPADAATQQAAPADAAAPTATSPDAAPAAMTTPDAAPPAATNKNSGPTKKLAFLPKSWSRKKVKDYMKKTMNRGLGVKCKHCHNPQDHAAPHKNKKVALDMLKMTDRLNRSYFKGKKRVTCYTCHLGKKKP